MYQKLSHVIKEISMHWRSSVWWKKRYIHWVLSRLLKNNGIYIVDYDWKNLIILDACRADIFQKINNIEGKMDYKISRGSTTEDFLMENFKLHKNIKFFNDIVYVTANPYVNLLLKDTFFKIYPVWEYGWSEAYNTVLPFEVVKEALRARKEHPDKRLIIHFMQPHFPFIGYDINGTTGFANLRESTMRNNNLSMEGDVIPWELVMEKKLDKQYVVNAYMKNLEIVLKYVNVLSDYLSGKTIITSDHGNMLGDRIFPWFPFTYYGHPSRLYLKPLVEVPWFTLNKKNP